MKPAAFAFNAPRTLEEVVAAMQSYGEDGRILAGGQSLVPLMNLRMLQPAVLVSINDCLDLAYLRAEDNTLYCGAATRQWDVESDPLARDACPLLVQALHFVGGRSNRNRGTLCGSLAHADPLAELPTVALALDATIIANGPSGRRKVPAAEFFVGPLENCLESDEIVEAAHFPFQDEAAGSCFLELGNRKHGFALAGVAAEVVLDDAGRCERARLSVMGGASMPRRLSEIETHLTGATIDSETAHECGVLAVASTDPAGDFHADRAYRQQLVAVLVERALLKASAAAAANTK